MSLGSVVATTLVVVATAALAVPVVDSGPIWTVRREVPLLGYVTVFTQRSWPFLVLVLGVAALAVSGRTTTTFTDTIATLTTRYWVVQATRNNWTSPNSNQVGLQSVALGTCNNV